jgi:hypothetical protein
MLKIRKALEEALRAGVPRPTIDRIAWIMKEASEGIVEDGPDRDVGSRNGDTPC